MSNQSDADKHDVELASEKSSGGRGCLYGVAAFLLLLGLAITGLPLIVDVAIQQIEPRFYDGLDEFMNKPVPFPAEWKHAAPFSRDFVGKAREWSKKTETGYTTASVLLNSFRQINTALPGPGTESPVYETAVRGYPLPETTWTLMRTAVKALEPLRLTAIPMMTDPEFNLQALHELEESNFQAGMQQKYLLLVNQIALETAVLLHDGKSTEAATLLATVIPSLRWEDASDPTTLTTGYAMAAGLSHPITFLSQECSTSETLRTVLDAMNGVYPNLVRPERFKVPGQEGTVLSLIAPIRRYQRLGYPFSVENSKPLLWHLNARRDAGKTYLESKLATASPSRQSELRKELEALNNEVVSSNDPWFVRFLIGACPRLHTSLRMRNSGTTWFSSSESTKHPLVMFDLARLSIIEKLLMIQGRDVGTSISALVPEFLPEVPKDAFSRSGDTYHYSATKKKHYSVGPDQKDDRGEISGDDYPTTGDLMLPYMPHQPGMI